MGIRFNALGKAERSAVVTYVKAEYDKLIFQQPNSYVSKNAQADPKGWQDALRELIASDPRKVGEIMEAAHSGGGFTLIELSVVLVIIGLIVGGILVGQSLIQAAYVRATISQIEKYNQAANTFRGKYGYLPGDVKDPDASSFGLQARGQYAGGGDGNAIIEGVYLNAAGANGNYFNAGETLMFWVDLNATGLIAGNFTRGSPSTLTNVGVNYDYAVFNTLWPQAALGRNNYVLVGSNGGANYFSILGVVALNCCAVNGFIPTIGMTVAEASAIDTKLDDGLPTSGNITASEFGTWVGADYYGNPNALATPGTSTTCYDNNNVGGAASQYSMEQHNGAGVNCAISIKAQF